MRDGQFPQTSDHLLQRWLNGDEEAAAELWQRHAARLTGLVRKILSADLARQLDAEDVVQSVYLRFFAAARTGTLDIKDNDDLWRLLVAIMRNKLHDHRKGRQALKRKTDDAPAGNLAELQDPQPTPGDQVAFADEKDQMLSAVHPSHRRIVALRLDGWKVEEIAARTANHERTVRRVLKRVRHYLRQRCEGWVA